MALSVAYCIAVLDSLQLSVAIGSLDVHDDVQVLVFAVARLAAAVLFVIAGVFTRRQVVRLEPRVDPGRPHPRRARGRAARPLHRPTTGCPPDHHLRGRERAAAGGPVRGDRPHLDGGAVLRRGLRQPLAVAGGPIGHRRLDRHRARVRGLRRAPLDALPERPSRPGLHRGPAPARLLRLPARRARSRVPCRPAGVADGEHPSSRSCATSRSSARRSRSGRGWRASCTTAWHRTSGWPSSGPASWRAWTACLSRPGAPPRAPSRPSTSGSATPARPWPPCATRLTPSPGFCSLVRRAVEDHGDRFGLRVEFTFDGDHTARIAPRTQAEILRIVQEALSNVARHADATVVGVRLADQGRPDHAPRRGQRARVRQWRRPVPMATA